MGYRSKRTERSTAHLVKLSRRLTHSILSFVFIPVFLFFSNVQGDAKSNVQSAEMHAFTRELQKALRDNSWGRAISVCTAYINKHPNDARVRAVRGYALVQGNRDAQSLPDLDAAIKAGLSDFPVELVEDNSNTILSMRGFALMRTGKLKEGIADIEKSLRSKRRMVAQLFNEHADYENLAAAYMRLGNGAKAAQYKKASEENERQIQLILQPQILGDKDARAKVEKLKNECKAAPDSSIPLTKLAVHQIYLKAWSDALKSVDKALAIEPHMSRTHILRLEILKSLQKEAEAKKETDYLLMSYARSTGSAENAGERIIVTSRMIEIFKKFNDLEGQIAVLESLANKGTAGESELYDLGQCFAQKKQWTKAVEAYSDALDYATDNQPLILDARAKARRMLGQAREAEKDTAEAVRLRNKRTKI